jgi:hypothetical protein
VCVCACVCVSGPHIIRFPMCKGRTVLILRSWYKTRFSRPTIVGSQKTQILPKIKRNSSSDKMVFSQVEARFIILVEIGCFWQKWILSFLALPSLWSIQLSFLQITMEELNFCWYWWIAPQSTWQSTRLLAPIPSGKSGLSCGGVILLLFQSEGYENPIFLDDWPCSLTCILFLLIRKRRCTSLSLAESQR